MSCRARASQKMGKKKNRPARQWRLPEQATTYQLVKVWAMGEEVLIAIPAPLKAVLEDDCYRVLRRGKLCHLPAESTVEGVLRDYYMTVMDGATEETNLPLLSEVLDGLKVYFDFMLADHLLYAVEKDQHRSLGILNPVSSNKKACNIITRDGATGKMPSQVYGPTHLLRLFVRLPHFLMTAQLPSAHIHLLHGYFKDLLGYLLSHQRDYFKEEHYCDTASADDHLPQTNSSH